MIREALKNFTAGKLTNDKVCQLKWLSAKKNTECKKPCKECAFYIPKADAVELKKHVDYLKLHRFL